MARYPTQEQILRMTSVQQTYVDNMNSKNPPVKTPVNLILPVVLGELYVGDVLTTSNGIWLGSPTSYSYQWKRGAINIGTNANTYTLVSADATRNITCVVTATNAIGSTPATSNIVTPAALSAPVNIEPPVIDGGPSYNVGVLLSLTGNVWDGNPVPVLTYQWMAETSPIKFATNSTLQTTIDEEDKLISVECTATNSQSSSRILSNEVFIEP